MHRRSHHIGSDCIWPTRRALPRQAHFRELFQGKVSHAVPETWIHLLFCTAYSWLALAEIKRDFCSLSLLWYPVLLAGMPLSLVHALRQARASQQPYPMSSMLADHSNGCQCAIVARHPLCWLCPFIHAAHCSSCYPKCSSLRSMQYEAKSLPFTMARPTLGLPASNHCIVEIRCRKSIRCLIRCCKSIRCLICDRPPRWQGWCNYV